MVVIISELEVVRMTMGRMLRVVVSDVVDVRIGDRVMAKVCLELLGGVVPAQVTRQRRQGRQIGWDRAVMGVAVISVSRLVSMNMRMGRISSMVGLRGDMKQVIGRVLQQVVLGDRVEVDSRIDGRVMVHVWLELEGGMILVAARRLSEPERVAHNESVLR